VSQFSPASTRGDVVAFPSLIKDDDEEDSVDNIDSDRHVRRGGAGIADRQ